MAQHDNTENDTLALWHRFQQDTLLGVASIPLSPLLQESWVQGTAPVLATMTKADSQTQDRVQVTTHSTPLHCAACLLCYLCCYLSCRKCTTAASLQQMKGLTHTALAATLLAARDSQPEHFPCTQAHTISAPISSSSMPRAHCICLEATPVCLHALRGAIARI